MEMPSGDVGHVVTTTITLGWNATNVAPVDPLGPVPAPVAALSLIVMGMVLMDLSTQGVGMNITTQLVVEEVVVVIPTRISIQPSSNTTTNLATSQITPVTASTGREGPPVGVVVEGTPLRITSQVVSARPSNPWYSQANRLVAGSVRGVRMSIGLRDPGVISAERTRRVRHRTGFVGGVPT